MFGAMLDYSVDLMTASGADPGRIAVVVGSDAGSQDMARVVAAMAAERHLTLLTTVTYPSNLTDATPVVSAMLQNKPALVLMSGFTPDVILLVRTLRNVGLTMPITTLSGSISNNSVGASLGKAAEGFMGVVSWNWDLPIDGEKAFIERYHHDFPNQPNPSAAETLGEGYAIGWLIKASLEKAASADPMKLRDALASLTLPSILPGKPIAFDDKGLNTGLVPILVTWTNGELRTLWPQQYQTTKLKP
jgi:branched-chain amino acid transport system substrate-binding protein